MRPLEDRLNRQGKALTTIARSLKNVEERMGFLEAKLDQGLKTARDGNNTRNLIAILVALKMVFDNVNLGSLESILKLIGG